MSASIVLRNELTKTHSLLTIFTDMQFVGEESEKKASNSKSLRENTDQLVFISGQSNPLLFLNEFEKCRDVKTEKDKMFKIRNFVDACHKGEMA